jgi:hypothetical protein
MKDKFNISDVVTLGGIIFFTLIIFLLCLSLVIALFNGFTSDAPVWFEYTFCTVYIFGFLWAILGLVVRITKEKNNLKITEDGKE